MTVLFAGPDGWRPVHDGDLLEVTMPHPGHRISLGFFSRDRVVPAASASTANGVPVRDKTVKAVIAKYGS